MDRKRKMLIIPAAIVAFILFFTFFGDRGVLRLLRLSSEKKEMEKRITELTAENERLKKEVEALKVDRRYLESIARKELGLVKKDEIIYLFPQQGQEKR